jgi:hypothetical protein
MSGTRSGKLLTILEALRRDGGLTSAELTQKIGSAGEVSGLVNLLTKANLAHYENEILYASDSLGGVVGLEKLGYIEEYVFGEAEVRDFRRLMDFLTKVSRRSDGVGVKDSPHVKGKEKEEVNPEVLKRYVKEYIGVESTTAEPEKHGKEDSR